MEEIRKPFQGLVNIVRFNWHFYFLALLSICAIYAISSFLKDEYHFICIIICLITAFTTITSLLVSYYIYDLSPFYKLNWVDDLYVSPGDHIVNIHAGFDETSMILGNKFPNANLSVLDFYDPVKHTEVSIKRARKAYPAYDGTLITNTEAIPLPNDYASSIFIIFSAHEIRNQTERENFFIELKRILKPGGEIIMAEHLRDIPNFLAYNIGFFHFLSPKTWYVTFKNAGLQIYKQKNFTPFVRIFILKNDDH